MKKLRNRAVFRSGKRLDFCILDYNRHFHVCWISLADSEINSRLTIGALPISRLREEEYFTNLGKDQTNIVFAIEDKAGNYLGNIGLHHIDWLERRAEGGIFILAKDQWGKGIATEAEAMLLDYAFRTLNLRKISAGVCAENIGSLKAAKKNGFQEEGCLKKHFFRDGAYHDAILLAIFQEDWLAANPR
jgi:RimJ/RimL family protein N-acetyltransferase